jgi:shikimate dehydrogenase
MALDESSLSWAMSQVDLVVNATPIGFLGQDAPSLISSELFEPRHYAYDIVDSTKPTPLMQAANQAGARSADGSSMTLLQGALAFEKWLEKHKTC